MTGPVRLVASDPAWAGAYAGQEERIRAALGARALRVEHVGSTAVPGLVAKPIVDVLRIREPDWHEHRMLKGFDPEVNLHVFGADATEVERMPALHPCRSTPTPRRG
ncbi:MAG TPA: GrpB family protein [Solirubrobacteraceae bacterium]|nr:GrpB family protein [Solirubrobacteraceae bacterium]